MAIHEFLIGVAPIAATAAPSPHTESRLVAYHKFGVWYGKCGVNGSHSGFGYDNFKTSLG